MSDVEFMTQRNWEQRRHAEEYAAQLKENKVIRLDRIAAAPAEPRNDRKFSKRNKGGMAKAARAAGRIAMVASAASALAGLELLFPLFGLVAVIFYALHFELKGDEKTVAQDLKKKLEDAGTMDCIGRLREIAEEMFVRFYTASGDAAEEKGKNLVLMQEIQRLEKENGELKTELVDTEERYWKAHEEVEKAKKSLHDLVGQIAALVEENRKMKRELGERIATAPAEPRNDSAACECPKCGSMDTAFVTVCGEEGLQKCNVCDTHYEVE